VTISADQLAGSCGADPPTGLAGSCGADPPTALTAAAQRVAIQAAQRAVERARADAATADGCAHQGQTPAYRPPPRLQDFVVARDQTCRFPRCRQPAWRGDMDHTIAYHRGGRTCRCNLGGLCRTHHLLKQREGWLLRQIRPGIFAWTTPAGLTYVVKPDAHLV
jgi:hypothetical protein